MARELKPRYIFTDGEKSLDLPQYPDEAWHFYSGNNEVKGDELYASVAAVFRAVNLTADATASIPFAITKTTPSRRDVDISSDWKNEVGFMPNPKELIRLWRMSLTMTNTAYGFMETKPELMRYIAPSTIVPKVDNQNGLVGFTRSIGTSSRFYPAGPKCPIMNMWRLDYSTELLASKATEFGAMMNAAGILYWSDHFVEAFFKRGGIKPTMLVLKGMTTKENIEKIEGIWDKVVRGYYKFLGKVFQGVDANGGLEAQTIGEGVESMKDDTLTNQKIEAIAMAMGIPLSLLLSNSANYATAMVEYKSWYETSLTPWCNFMAECLNDQIFNKMNLHFEFRPEITDPGQEDEVSRAGAYSTYVTAGIKPSIAAQIVGIELPEGVEYDALDEMAEEKQQMVQDIANGSGGNDKPSSSDESSSDNQEEVPPENKQQAKFIPSLDQLHEMEIWRKFAYRKLKKGESLEFPFETRSLPENIASFIRQGLSGAESAEDITQVFDIGDTATVSNDVAIFQLADAINRAYANETTF